MGNRPEVTNDDFIPFLFWLVEKESYTAKDIIYVVEKPWHYEAEYEDYKQYLLN